jgi:hypothetical protein
MNNKFNRTIKDLEKALTKNKIEWLLTRLMRGSKKIDDLDVLVRRKDFKNAIFNLKSLGYQTSSHNQALGGRKKGYQINIAKNERIKIDLHKDFTWRKSKYIDTSLIWSSKKRAKVGDFEIYTPSKIVDVFLIYMNILFEKTYITFDDKQILQYKSVLSNKRLLVQASKYHWIRSLKVLSSWLDKKKFYKFPVLLPIYIIAYSYLEKFIFEKKLDLVSLLYFLYFRTRLIFTGKLPY